MEHGVEPKHFHMDNGMFNSKAFVEALKSNHQMITKSGVGVDHQNGVAEWTIGAFQAMAWAMLLHVWLHWLMNLIYHHGHLLSTMLWTSATIFLPRWRMNSAPMKHLQASSLAVVLLSNCVSLHVHAAHWTQEFKMGRKFQSGTMCLCRAVFWLLQRTLFKGWSSAKSEDWMNHTSISCDVQWTVSNSHHWDRNWSQNLDWPIPRFWRLLFARSWCQN